MVVNFGMFGHSTYGERRHDDVEIVRSDDLARGDDQTRTQSGKQHSPSYNQHITFRIRPSFASLIKIVCLLRFLIPRGGRPVRKKAIHELHALSYLDALRGYLALIIYTGHTMSRRWRWIPEPIIAIPWLQFPFRGGHVALDIFFWISGYALTYRLVGFMQSNKPERALDALVSSVFRRYLRLFLPMVFMQFITVVAIVTGVAILPAEKAGIFEGNPILFFLMDTAQALNPFAHVVGYWTKKRAGPQLLDQFWSINTEFRSSMILFMFCTATCKMTTGKRQRLIWLCIAIFMCWQSQWAAMAFLGMWFAERRQQKVREEALPSSRGTIPAHTGAHSAATSNPTLLLLDTGDDKEEIHVTPNVQHSPAAWTILRSRIPSTRTQFDARAVISRIRQPLLLSLFLYSFYFVMDPREHAEKTAFPHNLLNFLTPSTWPREMKMHVHLAVGAFMMLYPLDQIPALQKPLFYPFSQYLGELSFGIYAMHFTVRWIVWDPRYVAWQKTAYGRHDFDFFWILFPGYVVMTITILWAAELFRRVDMRIVTLCKDLETRLFA